jgi:hypothetical protein
VDIFIDGVNLVEILKEHESLFAGSIAGDYMGLPPEIVFLPSRHFLGEPVYEYPIFYKEYINYEKARMLILYYLFLENNH